MDFSTHQVNGTVFKRNSRVTTKSKIQKTTNLTNASLNCNKALSVFSAKNLVKVQILLKMNSIKTRISIVTLWKNE